MKWFSKKYVHITFLLSCRVTKKSILWNAIKESGKAFLVYADLVKDAVFLAIIVQAIGGFTELLKSTEWNFANTVSLNSIQFRINSQYF